jgi:hypothetical protein
LKIDFLNYFNRIKTKGGMESMANKQWLKAAGVRAVKTMAQTFIASAGTSAVMADVNWQMVLSASVLAGLLSLATSVAGLPEVSG